MSVVSADFLFLLQNAALYSCDVVFCVQAIAKYIPTGEPTLDTSMYEMVLSHFLEHSHEVRVVMLPVLL